MEARYKVVQQEIVFEGRLYSLTCNVNIWFIYLLFSEPILQTSQFFWLSYKVQTAGLIASPVTGDVDSHGTSGSYNLSTRINRSDIF